MKAFVKKGYLQYTQCQVVANNKKKISSQFAIRENTGNKVETTENITLLLNFPLQHKF